MIATWTGEEKFGKKGRILELSFEKVKIKSCLLHMENRQIAVWHGQRGWYFRPVGQFSIREPIKLPEFLDVEAIQYSSCLQKREVVHHLDFLHWMALLKSVYGFQYLSKNLWKI